MKTTSSSILLIDNNFSFTEVVVNFIARNTSFQYEIMVAHSASEAKAIISEFQPAIVLTDFNLPDMSGINFLPELRKLLPQCQIIVSTLIDTKEYRQAAANFGVQAFIPKSELYDCLPMTLERLNPTPSTVRL